MQYLMSRLLARFRRRVPPAPDAPMSGAEFAQWELANPSYQSVLPPANSFF